VTFETFYIKYPLLLPFVAHLGSLFGNSLWDRRKAV